jgi:ubiquitin-conjugating enzyme E2 Z
VAEPPPFEPPTPPEFDEDVEDSTPAFEPFKDLCKRRFLWYYHTYLNTIETAEKQHYSGEEFKLMPFEGGSNGMLGKFHYPELKRRLILIRQVLDQEVARWALEGMLMVKRETTVAANLHRQFEQLVELYRKNDMVNLNFELANPKNPFVWRLTYFGRPMTHLEGGMFMIKISISPRFPEEQPRVSFETPIFHHRVAKDGTLCYFPKRSDDLMSHIEAVIDAIEEEHPPYDPRTLVNPEAAKLFWGSEADKKLYNRQLRRSAQRSMEC